MSGSPVYIDGRLLGAVSYGWAFSKEPICGITPVADMLAVMERGLEPGDVAGEPSDLEGQTEIRDRQAHQGGLEPLATPPLVERFLADCGADARRVHGKVRLRDRLGAGGRGGRPAPLIPAPCNPERRWVSLS